MSERLIGWEDIHEAQQKAKAAMPESTKVGRIPSGVAVFSDGTLLWNGEAEINEIGGLPKALVRRSLDNLLKSFAPVEEANA